MVTFTLICGYCGYEWKAMHMARECPDCKKISKIAVKFEEEDKKDD